MRRKSNSKMSNNNQNHNHNNRRRFRGDSNTGKIKSAAANRDKYLNLARDAMAGGDRVEAENFLQHAEHYYRVLSSLQEEDARSRPERTADAADAGNGSEAADESATQAEDKGNRIKDEPEQMALAS